MTKQRSQKAADYSPVHTRKARTAGRTRTEGEDTGSGNNVWGKALPAADFALVFVSNEEVPWSLSCDAECFAAFFDNTATTPAAAYRVRDLWAHADLPELLRVPFNLTAALPIHGGVAAFRP